MSTMDCGYSDFLRPRLATIARTSPTHASFSFRNSLRNESLARVARIGTSRVGSVLSTCWHRAARLDCTPPLEAPSRKGAESRTAAARISDAPLTIGARSAPRGVKSVHVSAVALSAPSFAGETLFPQLVLPLPSLAPNAAALGTCRGCEHHRPRWSVGPPCAAGVGGGRRCDTKGVILRVAEGTLVIVGMPRIFRPCPTRSFRQPCRGNSACRTVQWLRARSRIAEIAFTCICSTPFLHVIHFCIVFLHFHFLIVPHARRFCPPSGH